jgi:hypothetical protein
MLKRSVIASGLFHVVVIVAASVAWPVSYAPADETPPAIPVELVTIADVSNIAPQEREQPKLQELAEVTPPPAQEMAVLVPPPDPVELEPAPLEPKPEPPPPPKPAEKPVSSAPANPAVPRRRPEAPQQKFDVDSVLALLDKRNARQAPQPNAKPAEQTVRGIGAQNAMTLDIKDALLAQMRECWNVPVGAPRPEELIVQVRVFLAPDGSLAQPPTLEPATRLAAAANPYMRTAAEAALRAVNVCEPYKRLPRDRYEAWREIVMTFDPGKMIGR